MIERDELPVVLIIEDESNLQELFRLSLEEVAVAEIAATVDEAKKLVDQYPEALLIAVDGELLGNDHGTEVVIYAKEKGFTGPIVAMSSKSNLELMAAGATHQVEKPKACDYLEELVIEMRRINEK